MNKLLHPSCKENLLALRDSLDLIGGKWKVTIILYLATEVDGKATFGHMQRELPRMSAKVLSKELKELEINKIITRTAKATQPVTVEYEMTAYGRTFLPVATVLTQWGLEHRKLIKSAAGS